MKKKPDLAKARKEAKAKEEKIRVVSSLNQAMEEISVLEAQVEAIRKLKASQNPHAITPHWGDGKSEATAFAIATDWHIGQLVRPESVNGLNSYDVATAKKRAATFFENVVKLTDKERQNVRITELVLFLGGDLIDGALHLDTIQSNEIAEPIRQAVIAQELIEGGLNFLLNHGRYQNITVVCCDGN